MTFVASYEKILIPAGTTKTLNNGLAVFYENDSFTYMKKIVVYAIVSYFVQDKNGNSFRFQRLCHFKGYMSKTNLNEFGHTKTEKEIQDDLIEMYKKTAVQIKKELLEIDKNCYPLFKLL